MTDGTRTCAASLSGSNGVATASCAITETATGSYSFTASYPGDSSFAPSHTNSATLLTVSKATSTTKVSLSPSSVVYGHEQTAKFSVTTAPEFAGTPTGIVTVAAGTLTLCKVTLSAGKGSCSPLSSALVAGTHSITATYPGSSDFGASTSGVAKLTVT